MKGQNMSEVRNQKLELREKYMPVRDSIPLDDKKIYDDKIFNRLISSITYRHSSDVLLYASFGSEPDTWRIFDYALGSCKNVAFPVCKSDHTMEFRYVTKKEELEEKTFGILEPKDSCPLCENKNFSLCIVPGLLFDKQGYRIGYGKGFYDRFLSSYRGVSIGLCYSNLLKNSLPKGRFDRHVDIVISEKGVYAVNAQK